MVPGSESFKKFNGGGGGLFDYSVTSGPGLSKVKCQVPLSA